MVSPTFILRKATFVYRWLSKEATVNTGHGFFH
jgi:hypothetical protein